jgi:anti-sigma B factor antagonist
VSIPTFQLRERHEADGSIRVMVSGELDLAVAGQLESRLRELADGGHRVELDLSDLEFMDSSGIRVVVTALNSSRSGGWQLTISPQLTDQVRRLIEITGLMDHLWPEPDQPPPPARGDEDYAL